ncbi:hypothetical protein BDV95DRAFT_470180, partial [Massariosphaeria phaeospora]
WGLGTLCCCLVIGALLGIIITTRNYNHKPIPDWPYGLTINTIIAAYSVVIKTAAGLVLAEGISHLKWTSLERPSSLRSFMVHDEASRGPWGAVSLLW